MNKKFNNNKKKKLKSLNLIKFASKQIRRIYFKYKNNYLIKFKYIKVSI